MHPIFGSADVTPVPQVPTANVMNPGMPLQNQYNQNYMSSPPQATVNPMNMNTGGFYQPQQQQQQQQSSQEVQDPNNLINYSNFNNFAGGHAQMQPQQSQSPQPSVQSPVQEIREKPPLPEEYIYLQTVLEELKTQCINRATNPVSSNISMKIFIYFKFFITANEKKT